MIFPDLTLFIEIAFFLVLLFALREILFKPLLELMEKRKRAILDRESTAQAWRAEANEKLFEYKSKMEKAAMQAEAIRNSLLREAWEKQREIIQSAQIESEKIIAEQIEQAKAQAEIVKKELEGKVSELAQDVVERLMR